MTHQWKYAVCIIAGRDGLRRASCLRAGLTTYGADLNPQALAVLQQAGAKQTAPSARLRDRARRRCCWRERRPAKQIPAGEQGLGAKAQAVHRGEVSSTISADDASRSSNGC